MTSTTKRARRLNNAPLGAGHVVYFMSRDQRVEDNWALRFAFDRAQEHGRQLVVVFSHYAQSSHGQPWHHAFMIEGLKVVSKELARRGIRFVYSTRTPAQYVESERPGLVICDFSPLRGPRRWRSDLAQGDTPVVEVDAHNVVPAWLVTNKQEYSAATFRPKIRRLLDEYLATPDALPSVGPAAPPDESLAHLGGVNLPSNTPLPGPTAAAEVLETFIAERLPRYDALRNDPNEDVQSGLSAYLHFGQLSAATVALRVLDSPEGATKNGERFHDELLVRRELSDNYCLFESAYDSFSGLPGWGRRTLEAHWNDTRDYLYQYGAWEAAATHDELWNASQRQLLRTGRIAGYLRMYWAKKILEWSASPEEAIATAIKLNDAYQLDGRDPNGYAGIAWSIGGLHDRPWFDRPVYGTIRYMNASGAARKFDVARYIRTWSSEQ
jgi:deoxyribodipyrimidine photo-lyase